MSSPPPPPPGSNLRNANIKPLNVSFLLYLSGAYLIAIPAGNPLQLSTSLAEFIPEIFGKMLFFYTIQELTCQFFASSVCKSLRVSSIIDSICHLIILLYHLHFASDSQKLYHRIKTPSNRFTLGRCIVLTRCQKFASSYFR